MQGDYNKEEDCGWCEGWCWVQWEKKKWRSCRKNDEKKGVEKGKKQNDEVLTNEEVDEKVVSEGEK